jgi:hypothetical protein
VWRKLLRHYLDFPIGGSELIKSAALQIYFLEVHLGADSQQVATDLIDTMRKRLK